jgi:O-antigen ligase
MVLLVATLGVAPLALLPMASPIYAGMATASPTLYTYTLAIALAATVMARRTMLAGALSWAPLFAWLIALTIFAWDLTPRLWSGLLHLALGAAAFAIGVGAAARDRDGEPAPTTPPWLFAAAAWVQFLAVALALVGLPLRTLTFALAQDVNGRATGLTTHPGELSKLLFFCAMCVLVLPQRTTRERWFAWSTFGAILVGVFLTQSRAALGGLVVMIGIFIGLEFAMGRWQRRHAVALGLTAALALASIPWVIHRFATDTGARGHTMRVAFDAIRDHPWTGVGVNSYVAVVGRTDPLTSTGVPVHNIFLLSAAEIGIIGALLLWLPFVAVSVRAVRVLRASRGADPAARVIVAALPGIVVIALTGWGLLQGPYFIVFAFVFGYFGSRLPKLGSRRPSEERVRRRRPIELGSRRPSEERVRRRRPIELGRRSPDGGG